MLLASCVSAPHHSYSYQNNTSQLLQAPQTALALSNPLPLHGGSIKVASNHQCSPSLWSSLTLTWVTARDQPRPRAKTITASVERPPPPAQHSHSNPSNRLPSHSQESQPLCHPNPNICKNCCPSLHWALLMQADLSREPIGSDEWLVHEIAWLMNHLKLLGWRCKWKEGSWYWYNNQLKD